MKYIVVDVESDGQILGTNSMVCFGAVLVDKKLDRTFYGQTSPISEVYATEALAISGFTREQHKEFREPKIVMEEYNNWLKDIIDEYGKKVVLLSDNNQYDGSWINWYMLTYCGHNPFGYTSRRIGDMFAGFMNNHRYSWKKHRKTNHTHHPVDDAKGNAEAVLWLIEQGFKIEL